MDIKIINAKLGTIKKVKKKKKVINKDTKKYKTWRIKVDYKNNLKKWSKLVQERDGNKCCICGAIAKIQSHHILDKKYYKEYSLEINNGVSLCVLNHKWSKFAAHTNPTWFTLWLMKNRPEQYKWVVEHIDEPEVHLTHDQRIQILQDKNKVEIKTE